MNGITALRDRLNVATAEALGRRLDALAGDVRGDDPISDAHPRFGDHVVVLAWAEVNISWVTQDTIDAASQEDEQMNSLMRAVIRTIRAEWM